MASRTKRAFCRVPAGDLALAVGAEEEQARVQPRFAGLHERREHELRHVLRAVVEDRVHRVLRAIAGHHGFARYHEPCVSSFR